MSDRCVLCGEVPNLDGECMCHHLGQLDEKILEFNRQKIGFTESPASKPLYTRVLDLEQTCVNRGRLIEDILTTLEVNIKRGDIKCTDNKQLFVTIDAWRKQSRQYRG